MRDMENHRFFMCLNIILMRANKFLWWKRNLSCLLKMVTHFFGEVHDSTTLEPTHEEIFSFLREVHNPTSIEPLNDDNFSLSDHLGELVLSPTSYTSKFRNIHPNEVWVKGFFFMVPHEEYGLSISPFDDDMIQEPYYLNF